MTMYYKLNSRDVTELRTPMRGSGAVESTLGTPMRGDSAAEPSASTPMRGSIA